MVGRYHACSEAVYSVAKTIGAISLLFAASQLAAASVSGSNPCKEGKELVKAKEIVEALRVESDEMLDCSGRVIKGNLDLYKLSITFDAELNENVIIVTRPLRFSKTVFRGIISTWDQSLTFKGQPRVVFASSVNFIDARFEDHVSLDASVFRGNAWFGGARFYRMGSFTEAKFQKLANFHSVQFDERALFSRAAFEGKAIFDMAVFDWLAFFHNARFYEPPEKGGQWASFLYTRFRGDTVFTKAVFETTARFQSTQFQGPTYFSKSIFKKGAWYLAGVSFGDTVTFKNAMFEKEGFLVTPGKDDLIPVIFSDVVFSGDAIFSGATFHNVAFGKVETKVYQGLDVIFRKTAQFRNTTFESLKLRGTRFEAEVDFSGARFKKVIDFTNVDIEKASVKIEWDQLVDTKKKPLFEWQGALKDGDFDRSGKDQAHSDFSDFLSSLEKHFRREGKLDDAAEAHFLKEEVNRAQSSEFQWFWNSCCRMLIYGYGVRPWNQIGVSLLLIIGFAFVYVRPNMLRYDRARRGTIPFTIAEIPADRLKVKRRSSAVKNAKKEDFLARYRKALSFSFYVFTKIGYRGVYARERYWYVVVEWLLGFVLWYLWLLNLSNTVPLLYRLVTFVN